MSDEASSSSNSPSRLPHPIVQIKKAASLGRSSTKDKENRYGNDSPVSDNKNVQNAFDKLTKKREDSLVLPVENNSRKESFSSSHSNHSFTQRRIDRGIAVPSSITKWDHHPRPTTPLGLDTSLSTSTGSLSADIDDSSNFFGLSPFVTPSFSNPPESLLTPYGRPAQQYVSLKHRYENENDGQPRQQSEDEGEGDHEQGLRSKAPVRHRRSRLNRLDTEDSDIELSDDDFSKSPAGVGHGSSSFSWNRPPSFRRRQPDITNKAQPHPPQVTELVQNTRDINDDDAFGRQDTDKGDVQQESAELQTSNEPQRSVDTTDEQKVKISSQPSIIPTNNLADKEPNHSESAEKLCSAELVKEPLKCDTLQPSITVKSSPPPASAPSSYLNSSATPSASFQPSLDKIRMALTPTSSSEQGVSSLWRLGARSFTPSTKTEPLRNPPRRHLLQTPVFQVLNANTLKDRFLFLFSDLLLICKPIMDETIIVSGAGLTGDRDKRFRFRPNENSLFQVKNIVPLSKVTLYLTREDNQRQQQQQHRQNPHTSTSNVGSNNTIPPSSRKMHPILAYALHEFEKSAERGVSYLIEKHLLTNDPLTIANFLFKTPDLNRRQLGYYLANPKNSEVYNAFLKCFRLAGLRLDEALRILLTTFRLPDKLTSLEYVIEVFAKKWHDANQNVVKFSHDMAVKVVELMLQLNSVVWYDANSDNDVYWHVCSQNNRRMTFGTNEKLRRETGSSDPLRNSKNMSANNLSTKEGFLETWKHYDRYELVPVDFMEDMYRSIKTERLETGWDNKKKRRSFSDKDEKLNVITVSPHRLPTRLTKGVASDPITISIPAPDSGLQIKLRGQDLICEPNMLDFSQSSVQTFTIKGNTFGRTSLMFIKAGDNAGDYVSPTLPRTKSLIVERSVMRYTFEIAFSHADIRAVKSTSTSSTGDGPSRMDPTYSGDTRVSYTSENMTSPLEEEEDEEADGMDETSKEPQSPTMVLRKYTFSVESEGERLEWIEKLRQLCGQVTIAENDLVKQKTSTVTKKEPSEERTPSAEERVALQVLKEVLLADEVKKGTANVAALRTTLLGTNGGNAASSGGGNGQSASRTSGMSETLSPKQSSQASRSPDRDEFSENTKRTSKKEDSFHKKNGGDRGSLITVSGGVTKRGHEIIKLVVQNSLVPLMLSFLRQQMDP